MEEWSLDVITGLKKVVLQISVQREYAVPNIFLFQGMKILYLIEESGKLLVTN